MRFRNAIIGTALLAATLSAGVWAQSGHGHAGLPGMEEGMRGHGGGHQRHGAGAMDPQRMQARLERRVGYAVWESGGTTEQRDRIVAIMQPAMTEVAALRKQRADLRAQGAELLKAATLDRAAVEKLRAEGMALAETASMRMSTAMLAGAEVLTPEQRVKFVETMAKRGKSGMGRRGAGRQAPDNAPSRS